MSDIVPPPASSSVAEATVVKEGWLLKRGENQNVYKKEGS